MRETGLLHKMTSDYLPNIDQCALENRASKKKSPIELRDLASVVLKIPTGLLIAFIWLLVEVYALKASVQPVQLVQPDRRTHARPNAILKKSKTFPLHFPPQRKQRKIANARSSGGEA